MAKHFTFNVLLVYETHHNNVIRYSSDKKWRHFGNPHVVRTLIRVSLCIARVCCTDFADGEVTSSSQLLIVSANAAKRLLWDFVRGELSTVTISAVKKANTDLHYTDTFLVKFTKVLVLLLNPNQTNTSTMKSTSKCLFCDPRQTDNVLRNWWCFVPQICAKTRILA